MEQVEVSGLLCSGRRPKEGRKDGGAVNMKGPNYVIVGRRDRGVASPYKYCQGKVGQETGGPHRVLLLQGSMASKQRTSYSSKYWILRRWSTPRHDALHLLVRRAAVEGVKPNFRPCICKHLTPFGAASHAPVRRERRRPLCRQSWL